MRSDAHVCCVCRRRLYVAFVQRRRSVQCSRCGQTCCVDCAVTRRYASLSPPASPPPPQQPSLSSSTATARDAATAQSAVLCATCHAKPNVLQRLPRSVWDAVNGYCDRVTQQRLLQLCHTAQMGVVLPYPYYARGWSMLFGERQVLYEGSNGQVCRTTLQPGVGGAAFVASSSSLSSTATTTTSTAASSSSSSLCSGEVVAVKVIAKANLYSLRRWDYVQREITALQRCRHSHVVGFYFAAHGPSELYIVLQYLQGGDLFDWLVQQQMPAEADVRVLAYQLLTTLHYMHEVCGVVHRDIKPENILLDTNAYEHGSRRSGGSGKGSAATPALHLRLADFGYCKVLPLPTRAAQRTALRAALACAAAVTHADAMAARRTHSRHDNDDDDDGTEKDDDVVAAAAQQAAHDARNWVVSATPCGTLGFAAPEVMHAYTARQQAMREPSTPLATRTDVNSSNNSSSSDGSTTVAAHAGSPLTSTDALKRMDVFAAGVTLCVLLTGCEPFPCHSPTAYMQAVMRGVDFGGLEWAHVSVQAKTLLRRMLAPSAAQRPTVLACLQSSWLCDAKAATARVAASDVARTTAMRTSAREMAAVSSPTSTSTTSTMALTDAVTTALSSSFRDSVHSLRKNGGWLFVQDKAGQVTTLSRNLVTSDEDAEGGWARRFAAVDAAADGGSSSSSNHGNHASNGNVVVHASVADAVATA